MWVVMRSYFCGIRVFGRSIVVSPSIRIVNIITTVRHSTRIMLMVRVVARQGSCIVLLVCGIMMVVLMVGSVISFIIVLMISSMRSVLVSNRVLRRWRRGN